jgi:hypothetical protein
VLESTVITMAQGVSLAEFEDQTMLIPTRCDPKIIYSKRKKEVNIGLYLNVLETLLK